MLGPTFQQRGQQHAIAGYTLTWNIERVVVLGLVVEADADARLHRRHDDPGIFDVELDGVGRSGECLLGLRGIAIVIVQNHVVGDVVIEQWRAGLHRLRRARHRRQRIDLDRNGFRRIPRLVDGLGDHECDRIADEPHLAHREDRFVGLQQRRAVAAFQRHTADKVAIAGGDHVFADPDTKHAGHLFRGGCVDRPDRAVSVRAAHHHAVNLSRQIDVVGIAALAANQRVVLLAHHRLAHAEFLRCNRILEGR